MSIGVGQDEPRAPILPLLFEEPEPEPEQRPGRGRRGRHLAEGLGCPVHLDPLYGAHGGDPAAVEGEVEYEE